MRGGRGRTGHPAWRIAAGLAIAAAALSLALLGLARGRGHGVPGTAAPPAAEDGLAAGGPPSEPAPPPPPGSRQAAPRAPEPPASPAGPGPAISRLRAELGDGGFDARAREVELAALARKRFDAALEESGVEADDVDPAVRDLFARVELEPVLREEGRIDGLTIRNLEPGSPLARAGFRPGDRIVWIHDRPLEDPAELPDLVIRLRSPVEVCAERAGEVRCAPVELDPPD